MELTLADAAEQDVSTVQNVSAEQDPEISSSEQDVSTEQGVSVEQDPEIS